MTNKHNFCYVVLDNYSAHLYPFSLWQLFKMLSKSQIIFLVGIGSMVLFVYVGLFWFWFYFGWSLGFG
jgi:hypothetical protein